MASLTSPPTAPRALVDLATNHVEENREMMAMGSWTRVAVVMMRVSRRMWVNRAMLVAESKVEAVVVAMPLVVAVATVAVAVEEESLNRRMEWRR